MFGFARECTCDLFWNVFLRQNWDTNLDNNNTKLVLDDSLFAMNQFYYFQVSVTNPWTQETTSNVLIVYTAENDTLSTRISYESNVFPVSSKISNFMNIQFSYCLDSITIEQYSDWCDNCFEIETSFDADLIYREMIVDSVFDDAYPSVINQILSKSNSLDYVYVSETSFAEENGCNVTINIYVNVDSIYKSNFETLQYLDQTAQIFADENNSSNAIGLLTANSSYFSTVKIRFDRNDDWTFVTNRL